MPTSYRAGGGRGVGPGGGGVLSSVPAGAGLWAALCRLSSKIPTEPLVGGGGVVGGRGGLVPVTFAL
jgi:hypothetical protein